MLKPELTGQGPILVDTDKELSWHSQPSGQPPIHADQLQPGRGDRWETVELEGEEDSPWPQPLHAALGIS